MKRYIDTELLKKEIESLKSLEYPCDNSEQNFGFEYALDRLSDSLTSLQQEQSCDTCTNDKGCVTCKDGELWEGKPVEDLEKEIKTWIPAHIVGGDEAPWKELKDVVIQWAEVVARHFYILGLKNNIPVTQITLDELAKEGEPINKDLDTEIEMEWDSFNKRLAKYDGKSEEVVWLNWLSFVDIANYFYELGKKSK